MQDKKVIGVVEKVKIFTSDSTRELPARIDTGATRSSIDQALVDKLKLGPVKETKMVKSALGNHIRPIIEVDFELGGKRMVAEFTVADRSHMKFHVLIGRNALIGNFLIDPQKDKIK